MEEVCRKIIEEILENLPIGMEMEYVILSDSFQELYKDKWQNIVQSWLFK